MTLINYKVALKNYQNKNIKVACLDENILRKFGFTDNRQGYWYYYKNVYHDKDRSFSFDVSFNISFKKEDGKNLKIDVLDEAFCQPYDYQKMLKDDESFKPALQVHANVQEIMSKLSEAGIISGYTANDYI